MRRFNPEKELKKIQNGNKNKIIISVIALLLVIAIGSSYALYQVRYSKRIIYTKVGDFSRDLNLAVVVDGVKQKTFPEKSEGKIYTGIECDKEYEEAYFDNTEWELHFSSKGPNKCTIKFETGNLPNAPELYQGMIPVVFSDTGIMYVADTSKDWYNYQDHRWANAVLVDASNTTIKNKYFNGTTLRTDIIGKEVPLEEVLQMYVWIPRYKYQLWNVNNEGKPKQIINIAFEKDTANTGDITCTYTDMKDGTVEEKCLKKGTQEVVQNNDWYTHPAFTFGNTELKGFWVGKFEPSDPGDSIGRNSNISEITILPGKTSMILKSVSIAFIAERNIELQKATKYNLNSAEVDTHLAKNIEWGAIAYLTQSIYGIYKDEKTCNIDGMTKDDCEIWINNTAQGTANTGTYAFGGTYTGCVGDSVSVGVKWNTEGNTVAKCDADKRWNTANGVKASTTGNMYGIYDISGGTSEYVMGATVDQKGGLSIVSSGFTTTANQTNTLPELKYYDMYTSSDDQLTHERGHLGDATREILQTIRNTRGNWNKDYTEFPTGTSSSTTAWFRRGGAASSTTSAGAFGFFARNGDKDLTVSFRSILSAA